MKGLFIILLSLAALASMISVLVIDLYSQGGGHESDSGQKKIPFAAQGMSRERYINYLLRTEKHDDPELWRRIEAVKNLKRWPEQ